MKMNTKSSINKRPPVAPGGQQNLSIQKQGKRQPAHLESHEITKSATVEKLIPKSSSYACLNIGPLSLMVYEKAQPHVTWFPETNERHLNLNNEMRLAFVASNWQMV